MDYQTIQLSEIDLSKLTLVKESTSRINGQDHSRWVFRDDHHNASGSHCTRYLKIWNPQHVRRDNVLNALEASFYDKTTVPALSALIFHKDVCRGYVTEACRMTYRDDAEFYQKLKDKTTACEFFAIQYSRYHVGVYDGRCSLIDLESVHPIKELPNMQSLESSFDDNDYGQFVASRYLALYPGKYIDLGDYNFLRKESWKTKVTKILNAIYPILILRVWQSRLQQWLRIKFCATHTHLIEF